MGVKEIWKDIKGYEGYYQVSNCGRVRSLDRKVKYSDGRIYNYKGGLIKGSEERGGYKTVTITKNDVKKHFKIHQLVLITFKGYKPNGLKTVVDHIDGDVSNNNIDNLQILTNRQNVSKGWMSKETSSKYTGVCWDKERGKWRALATFNGVRKCLGRYESEYKAHKAYFNFIKNIDNVI